MSSLFDFLPEPTPVERLPAQRHSRTSVAAASAAEPMAARQRREVFEFIRGRGPDGATDDEVQAALGLNGSSQRPRRIELVEAGLVINSGLERPTRSGRGATVWVAVEAAAPQPGGST